MNSKLGKNAIYNMIYQMISIVIPLITSPYLARVIGAEGVGQYSVTNSIANYFFVFAMLGVNNYGNRSIAQNKSDRQGLSNTFWQIYYMQIVCGLVMTFIYFLFCCFGTAQNMRVMYMIQGIYVFSSVTDINWFAFGMENFKATTIRNIAVKILTTFSIFLFVKTENDIVLYTLIIHLGTIVGLLVIWPMIMRETDIIKPNLNEMLKHLKKNVVLFIPYLAGSIYHGMDKTMLGILENNEVAGYYTYALNILNIPISIITAICTVFMPRVSHLMKQNKNKVAFFLFEKGFLYMCIMTIAMCFGVMLIAPIFVPYYLGEGYEQTAEMLSVLAICIVPTGLTNVLHSMYLIPYEKDKIYIISIITSTAVNCLGNLILIPFLSGYGACWATVVAKYSSLLIEIIMTFKEVPYLKWIKKIIPYIFGGFMMYGIGILISGIELHPILLLGMIITTSAVFYLSIVFIILFFIEKDEFIIDKVRKIRR